MKQIRCILVIAILALTMAAPSNASAQSWWEGFATSEQANALWDWLQQHPEIAGILEQNPYQVYDENWRGQHPEFQRYVDNNPGWWNGMVANGSQNYSPAFNQFLSTHPQVARDLLNNPQLIYNQTYRSKHPQLQAFLASHPNTAWQPPKKQTYAYSPNAGWGAYNNQGQWRNEKWFKQNGDWDKQNKWHDSNWWKQNNRVHAEQHHPNWFVQPEQKQAKQQIGRAPGQPMTHRREPATAGR